MLVAVWLAGAEAKQVLAPCLLGFWSFYYSSSPPVAHAALPVRDLLAWATFVNTASPQMGAVAAYAHGAYLMILMDGIGQGLGMA